ncbi:MAG: hypothetical protein ABI358_12910 [Ginsengibacter sp.]
MQKVKNLPGFKKAVRSMAMQKDATIFHCYICGDIFKIATAKKVQQFDFSDFKNEKDIMKFISVAIEILRKELPQQILLFDEICNPML